MSDRSIVELDILLIEVDLSHVIGVYAYIPGQPHDTTRIRCNSFLNYLTGDNKQQVGLQSASFQNELFQRLIYLHFKNYTEQLITMGLTDIVSWCNPPNGGPPKYKTDFMTSRGSCKG